MARLTDRRIAAVQRAHIDELERAGVISDTDADDARIRAGQVMVLRADKRMLIHVYGVDGIARWTHVLEVPSELAGVAAALAVDHYLTDAIHEHYDVGSDDLGRTIATPRKER